MGRPRVMGMAALVAALAASLPAGVRAQATPVADLVGDRVRLTTSASSRVMVGEVASVTADSLMLLDRSGATSPVAVADIVGLERSLGRTNRTLRGMAWGAGVGFAAGGAGGAALMGATCGSCDPKYGAAFAVGGVLGAAGGGLVGAMIGAVSSGERWESLEIRAGGLSISLLHLMPYSGGEAALAFRIRSPR